MSNILFYSVFGLWASVWALVAIDAALFNLYVYLTGGK